MVAPMIFQNGVQLLEGLGVSDVILPFLLVFTIVFAIMQKMEILGNKKNFAVVIALVMALAVVIPHVTNSYPPGADVVNIVNQALPNVSVVAVAVVMILLLIGLFGGRAGWGSSLAGLVAIAAFVIVIWIFYQAAYPGSTPGGGTWGVFSDPDVQALLLIVVIFGVIVWLITKEPSQGEHGSRFLDTIQNFFGGGGHGGGHH